VSDTDLLNGLLPFPVSFTTLALMLFAIIAGIAFVRGVLRLIFGTIALGIGAVAAYYVYLNAPDYIESPRGILIAAITSGLVTYIAARYLIINVLLRPFIGDKKGSVGKVGALVSLIPTTVLVLVLASGFRLTGTVMEMEQLGNTVTAENGEEVENGWLAHWRQAMDNDRLARFLEKVDPFVEKGRAALVNLLISGRDKDASRELVAYDKDTEKIVDSPAMKKLQSDPEIRELVESGEYVQLLQHPKVRRAVRESDLGEHLKSIDIPGSLEKALYSEKSDSRPKVRKRVLRFWKNGDPEE